MSTITTDQIQARVFAALEEFGAEPGTIELDAPFAELDVDSLDMVELAQIVKEEYSVEISGEDFPKLKTVRDAVDLVVARA